MSDRVPVVDIAPLEATEPGPGFEVAVARITEACREHGFFQVTGHRVPGDLIERMWEEARRLFALPRERKLEIARTAENPRGYYDRELTKNRRDLKEVFDFGYLPRPELADDDPDNRAAVDGSNQWPADLPGFRPAMMAYFEACELLGRRILEAFCLGLEIPRDRLRRYFVPEHTSFVRLNYYPLEDPLSAEEAEEITSLGDMALHHHTDAGALTILLQDDVGGLQVFDGREWLDIRPVEGAFVINVADMMQVWSNDSFVAALHRVRPMRGSERLSVPFFYNPSYSTGVAPITAHGGEEPRYKTVNWGAFRAARTAGDYADVGAEIQIANFRIG